MWKHNCLSLNQPIELHFISLLCLTANNFTRQEESTCTQCFKFTSDETNSEPCQVPLVVMGICMADPLAVLLFVTILCNGEG
jgi:hypothetical protein